MSRTMMLAAALLGVSVAGAQDTVVLDSPWALQTVDADSVSTHPKVGAAVEDANKVVVEGIALNAPSDMLDTNMMWQVCVQGLSPDRGGIAAFSAVFYNGENWPKYPADIRAGDLLRIEGFTAHHNGKVNINERHSPAPELEFEVTVLERGVGLPAPQVIFDLGQANVFDHTRAGGGERYQAQWCEVSNVQLLDGVWAPGETVTVVDDAGSTFSLLLAAPGVFENPPEGRFSVRGVFDQEDPTEPWTDGYRLWVMAEDDVTTYGGCDSAWALQAVDADGFAVHPKVGAAVEPANRVTLEGIALNAPAEMLNTNMMWQVYVQPDAPDLGGVAVFSAVFYNGANWPKYPDDIRAGDRVRVTGYVAEHLGKTNLNERHSPAPDLEFEISVIEPGVGLPAPVRPASLAACNYFDETRTGGAELYQGRWTELSGLHLSEGAVWAPGETVVVEDVAGDTFDVLLSSEGDFSEANRPEGAFTARGIFDQEDPEPPFTGGYRLWVLRPGDIIPVVIPAAAADWMLYQ